MGLFNWLKKKEKSSVETTYEEAEQELQGYGGETVVQTNPFQVIKDEGGHESMHGGQTNKGGGCCGGGQETVQLSRTKPVITKINKDLIISDVIQAHPQAVEIMMKNGLHCFGCGGNVHESIENGAKGHGMTTAQVNKIVMEINNAIALSSPSKSVRNKTITGTKKSNKKVSAPSAGGGKKK